jgi:phosphatidylserine/phosphatidylglycerophosphate/cardiolipin synthase-like enzyme
VRHAVRTRAVYDPALWPWKAEGENEANRAGFCALARTGIRVRTDGGLGALMHSNFIVASDIPEANSAVMVTSANLTRSNTQRHYNASVGIRSPAVAGALAKAFDAMWAGGFKKSVAEATIDLSDGSTCTVLCGAKGETLAKSGELIDQAEETVDFAMFVLATENEAFAALLRALARGVRVRGVVDGDQVGQPWDGVPTLLGAGGNVRYTPGVLTGGQGRMHQKTMVVDGDHIMVGTGNWSAAARKEYETAVVVATSAALRPWLVAQYVKSEIDRLFELSPNP